MALSLEAKPLCGTVEGREPTSSLQGRIYSVSRKGVWPPGDRSRTPKLELLINPRCYLSVKIGRLLKLVRRLEQLGFGEVVADQLHAHRLAAHLAAGDR